MSNATNAASTLSPDLIRAITILPIMDKYMLIILYISGIIGSVLNIITLLQKKFRKNPCSLYFLSASITDFTIMNGVLMTDAMRYFNQFLFTVPDSITIWCKLSKYFVFLLPCLASTFIALACFDRFCTSSPREKLRGLSQLKISRILILTVSLIWIIFSLHVIITYNIVVITTTKSTKCTVVSKLPYLSLVLDGFFFAIFNGAIVPLFLLIFGLLIYRNVRTSRRRTVPITSQNSNGTSGTARTQPLNRHNTHLIVMVLTQSSVTVFLNIPYMTIYLNGFYNNVPKDQLLLLVYYIFIYVARWFWFMNYVKTFYLNSLTSQVFRNALYQQLVNLVLQIKSKILLRASN